jgi:nucleotide-binding universal stress UspA family protein
MDGKVMKLLIAFDGSSSSETALSELKRAGLPQIAEALVLTVADVILPSAEAVDQPDPEWMAAVLEKAHRRAAEAVEQSHAIALRASKTVQAEFPNWRVRAEACADSPAWGVVKRVEEWKADLVVVGSHNRSALGRLTLGSVAQRVLDYAPTSVRIARSNTRPEGSPVRLVAGEDGSPGAEAALSALVARAWPAGSTVLLVTAIDPLMSTATASSRSRARRWVKSGDPNELAWIQRMNQSSVDTLRAAGLNVSPVVTCGDPRKTLLEEAERLRADCIFVGAWGVRGIERLLLGSVSTAIAARARCSVEVVRAAETR